MVPGTGGYEILYPFSMGDYGYKKFVGKSDTMSTTPIIIHRNYVFFCIIKIHQDYTIAKNPSVTPQGELLPK